LLIKSLKKPFNRALQSGVAAIFKLVSMPTRVSQSLEFPSTSDGDLRLKSKVIKALQIYLKQERKKDLNNALARKFYYFHSQLRLLNLLSSFASQQKRLRQLKQKAEAVREHQVLKQGL